MSLVLPCLLQRATEIMPSLWYLPSPAIRRRNRNILLKTFKIPTDFKLREFTKSFRHRGRQATMNESQQKTINRFRFTKTSDIGSVEIRI